MCDNAAVDCRACGGSRAANLCRIAGVSHVAAPEAPSSRAAFKISKPRPVRRVGLFRSWAATHTTPGFVLLVARPHPSTPASSAKLMRRAPGKVRCNSCVCAHVISQGSERPHQRESVARWRAEHEDGPWQYEPLTHRCKHWSRRCTRCNRPYSWVV